MTDTPRPNPQLSMARLTRTTTNVAQVICDICIYIAVTALFGIMLKYASPVDWGFYCDDRDIQHPHLADTVTSLQLMACTLAIPVLTIVLTEFFHNVCLPRHRHHRLSSYLLAVGKLVGMFLYGFSVTAVMTEVVKLSIGRPRPDFLEICKPEFNVTDCHQHRLIRGAECTNENLTGWYLSNSRKSFPSGHASFSFYSAIFVVVYLEYKLVVRLSLFFKSLVQLVVVLLAIFVSGTRISDNSHHPGDVIGGVAVGTLTALWTVFILAKHLHGESMVQSGGGGGIQALMYTDQSNYRQEQATDSTKSKANSHALLELQHV